jgi:hypothetical protein
MTTTHKSYDLQSFVEGDPILALKMLSDTPISGEFPGHGNFDRLPALQLKDGRTVVIGKNFVAIMLEVPTAQSEDEQ